MNQQEKYPTELNNMEEFQNAKTSRESWNMNSSFNISLPRDINDTLQGNEHDYFAIGSVDLRFPKLEKNKSLLCKGIKKCMNEREKEFTEMSEDDDYYYLYFYRSEMLCCFSFKDLSDELREVENNLKSIFKAMSLEGYQMLFNIEVYNHGR